MVDSNPWKISEITLKDDAMLCLRIWKLPGTVPLPTTGKNGISLHKQLVKYWLEFQYSFVQNTRILTVGATRLMLGETGWIRTKGAAEFTGCLSYPLGWQLSSGRTCWLSLWTHRIGSMGVKCICHVAPVLLHQLPMYKYNHHTPLPPRAKLLPGHWAGCPESGLLGCPHGQCLQCRGSTAC